MTPSHRVFFGSIVSVLDLRLEERADCRPCITAVGRGRPTVCFATLFAAPAVCIQSSPFPESPNIKIIQAAAAVRHAMSRDVMLLKIASAGWPIGFLDRTSGVRRWQCCSSAAVLLPLLLSLLQHSCVS